MLHALHQQVRVHGGVAQQHGVHGNAEARGFQAGIAALVLDAIAVQHHRTQLRTREALMHRAEQRAHIGARTVLRELQPLLDPGAVSEGAHLETLAQVLLQAFQRGAIGTVQEGRVACGIQRGRPIVGQHQHGLAQFTLFVTQQGFQQEKGHQRDAQRTQHEEDAAHHRRQLATRTRIQQPRGTHAQPDAEQGQPERLRGGQLHGGCKGRTRRHFAVPRPVSAMCPIR